MMSLDNCGVLEYPAAAREQQLIDMQRERLRAVKRHQIQYRARFVSDFDRAYMQRLLVNIPAVRLEDFAERIAGKNFGVLIPDTRVRLVRKANDGVGPADMTVAFDAVEARAAETGLAGQYIDFLLSSGHRRSFSIANAPHDGEHIELHVRHAKGGEFTDFVFEHLETKALLRMDWHHLENL